MHRRDKYAVYYDILKELPKTKMQITYSMQMSLPWSMITTYINRLEKWKLVRLENKTYYLTDKGRRYLEIYPALDLSKYFR